MKKLFSILAAFVCTFTLAVAQIVNPVQWSNACKVEGETLTVTYTASIKDGFHLYALELPEGGPQQTEFIYETLTGVTPVGEPKVVQGKLITEFDPNFEMELGFYEEKLAVSQSFQITASDWAIEGYGYFMSCSGEMCTPPTRYEFSLGSANAAAAPVAAPVATEAPAGKSALWTPVIAELNAFGNGEGDLSGASHSWWYILIAGFLAGLIALVTPCVWPMIPMTVSFFLKRTKDRKKSLCDAYTYGLAIIVIYVGLGLAVTAIFGASALNSLATNAVFNIIFFLLLVVFGFSFLGGFEIALPASWTSKLDEKADATTGLISIFFMAFTLCLVSFSCTGPIIGTLLVEAATSGSMLYPAIGMFGFALALSLPFTLFALFPSMLKSMPKSGGWLNMVKVVLGFCELALAFKFLSVADLAYGWGILDREVFLCIWIVIFFFLGLYLLGFIRLPHDDDPSPSDRVSVTRLMMALVSMSFAVYMIPGLWGAPCKAISAFAPPMSTQDFKLGEQQMSVYHDFEEGMAAAKQAGKPVLIDFSGYGCVNCRKMEAAVWSAPEVKQIIENDYVLIELMVDDKTALAQPEVVTENGQQVKLRTIGDKWSYLQRVKFGANAQPFYVLLNAEGKPLNGSYSYDEDVEAYVNFLNKGIENFKK
ncbi:MAG: cytochrome c biogenesis protein CcdA [Bacteroidales bacterium]|nr:cytochrome c biogenesis protein CcdA [Bacteroidales bacterium]